MAGGANENGAADLRTQLRTRGKGRLIGYAELVALSGVSRSTIERAWRGPWKEGEPRLPPPGKIKARAIWLEKEVDEWLVACATMQRAKLADLARENVEDLEPDQLEQQAIDLVVKSMELRTGEQIDAAGLGIHVSRSLSEEEFRAAERREFAVYSERFSGFSQARSWFLVAWLFPALRPFMQGDDEMFQHLIENPAQLEALGQKALHDDSWAELEAEWLAMRNDRKPN